MLPTAHVPRGARDDDAPFHQTSELVYLHRIIASVGHGHHDNPGPRLVDAIAHCVCRPLSVHVVRGYEPGLVLRVCVEYGDRRVINGVVHDDHFGRQRHGLEKPVQKGNDRVTLVVDGDLTPAQQEIIAATELQLITAVDSPIQRKGNEESRP